MTMRRPARRYTPRRREAPPRDERSDDLQRRQRVLRRVIVESIPLDSPVYLRYQERACKADDDPAERIRLREQLIAEVGLTERYAQELERTRP